MWHTYISTYSYDSVVAYMYNIGDEVEGKFVMSEHKELIFYPWKTKERYAFRMFCILFFLLFDKTKRFCISLNKAQIRQNSSKILGILGHYIFFIIVI